jgi:dihydroflavonol-4-reductase
MATESSPGAALVTGGAGFIGSRLVARLLGNGGVVRAVARTDASADRLRDAGCDVLRIDLLDRAGLADAARDCDVVYHLAGDYRVGIGADERAGMEATNVTAAVRFMDAAIDAGVGRIVHASTINAFGDTGYLVVDETYRRPQPYRYVSAYDETKHRAHLAAERRIADGAPVLIAMPGAVYGPGDHSSLGGQLRLASEGRLRAVTFGDAGLNMAHVDDIAAGIELVGTRGRIGEAYVIGGELTTLAELVRRVAAISGRRPPRMATPTWLLRGAAPLARLAGRNVAELVSASAGVTYWATDAKVRRELGYAPRDLEAGLTDTFGRLGDGWPNGTGAGQHRPG